MSNISDATAQARSDSITSSFCRPDRRTPLDQADNALLDQRIRANGYADCPLRAGGKAPFGDGWQRAAFTAPPSWTPNAPGLGVVMGGLDGEGHPVAAAGSACALDFDYRGLKSIEKYERRASDAEKSDAPASLKAKAARLRAVAAWLRANEARLAHVEQELAQYLEPWRAGARSSALERYRTGSPNFALLFRNDGTLENECLHLSVAVPVEGEAPEYVEVFGIDVLCAGRQLCGFHLHPDDGAPWLWRDDRSPETIPLAQLPPIGAEYLGKLWGFIVAGGERLGLSGDARAKSRKQFKPIPPAGLEPTPERIEAAGRIVEKQRQALAGLSTGRNVALARGAFYLGGIAWLLGEAVIGQRLLEACEANGSVADHGAAKVADTLERQMREGAEKPFDPLDIGPRPTDTTKAFGDIETPPVPANAPMATPVALPVERFRLAALCDLKLPPRDFLLGGVLCSTSRWLVVGQTGVGKTLFALELGAAVAAGVSFLDWQGRRRARVLYLDGELPAETLLERAKVVRERYGADIDLFIVGRDLLDAGADIPPLNTPQGTAWLWSAIAAFGPDLLILDSIMCLLAGDMSKEESWEPAKRLVRQISSRRIAQVWLHHTGHDTTKSYGTNTREWEMDTVIMLTKIEEAEEGGEGSARFNLEFKKARLKTPSNYRQFAPRLVHVDEGGFASQGAAAKGGKRKSDLEIVKEAFVRTYEKFAESVMPVVDGQGRKVRKVGVDEIRYELKVTGRLDVTDRDQLTGKARTLFWRARIDLMNTKGWFEQDDQVWRIDGEAGSFQGFAPVLPSFVTCCDAASSSLADGAAVPLPENTASQVTSQRVTL